MQDLDEMEKKKVESLTEVQKKMKKRNIKIVLGCVLGGIALYFIGNLAIFGLLFWMFESAEVEEYTNIAEYENYIGENADEMFDDKWGMDETIFPQSITEKMQVQDYIMVYYNPWDAMYLSHLVVDYEEEDYEEEIARLKAYESTEYLGYYGVTGFDEDYTLLAMYADDYQGFVYALTDNEDTIVYVEMIFCNYFLDLDYESYIPAEHLPVGFDAKSGNAYQRQKSNAYK